MNYAYLTLIEKCPLGGDAAEDCADCVYGSDYHLSDGECVLRTSDPSEAFLEAPEEVHR